MVVLVQADQENEGYIGMRGSNEKNKPNPYIHFR